MMSSVEVETLNLVLKFQDGNLPVETLNVAFKNKEDFYFIHALKKKTDNCLIFNSMKEHDIIVKRSQTENCVLIENRRKDHAIYLLVDGKKKLLDAAHKLKENDKFIFEFSKNGKIAYSFTVHVEAILNRKKNASKSHEVKKNEPEACLALTFHPLNNAKTCLGISKFNFFPVSPDDQIEIMFSKQGITDTTNKSLTPHEENVKKIFDKFKEHCFTIRYYNVDKSLYIHNIGGSSNPMTLMTFDRVRGGNALKGLKNLEPKRLKNGDKLELSLSDRDQENCIIVKVTLFTDMKSRI